MTPIFCPWGKYFCISASSTNQSDEIENVVELNYPNYKENPNIRTRPHENEPQPSSTTNQSEEFEIENMVKLNYSNCK